MIAGRIYEYARTIPEKTALIMDGRAISYRRFAAHIAAAHEALAARGVSADRVAVLCVHDLFQTWILGMALRGLGVTTVNARKVEDIQRLALGPYCLVAIAEEADAWLGLEELAAEAGAPMLVVSESVALGEASPQQLSRGGAHILLTSGTTGTHKKVLIDSAAEDRLAASNAERAGIAHETSMNVLNFGGWTAAGFFWPLTAWSVGGGVVIDQGPDLWRALALSGPGQRRIVVATPHMLANMLAGAHGAPLRNDAIRLFAVGGVLSRGQWQAARERLTHDIVSIYGATETTLMTFTPLDDADDLTWHRINAGCELQLVDEQDQTVPSGQIGMIRARPTRVEGYLNDPETSRAFFRDGYFYTGDLGVLREDGRLALQGRVTEVINVLGDKFGALPIELALQDRLGAQAVCVFSAPGETGEQMHVVIQPGRQITTAELKEALSACLPRGTGGVRAHKVDAMPRNHMGKIERAVLMAQLLPRGAGSDA